MKNQIMVALIFCCSICCWAADKIQTKEFVYKPVGWHKTGIMVSKGQKVKIKIKGRWSPDSGETKISASGIKEERWAEASFVPDWAHGRIIVYISDKPKAYYDIGTSKTFKAKSSGELVIGVNDKLSKDNTGELTVKVTY